MQFVGVDDPQVVEEAESVELDNAVSSCLIEGPNKTELHVNDLSLLGKYRR